MLKRLYLFFLLFSFPYSLVTAQVVPLTEIPCGFGTLLSKRQQADPLLTERLQLAEAQLQQVIKKGSGGRRGPETIYTLPLVVHVIHNGEAVGTANNPSDASIQAMVDQLNKNFRKNGSQYGGVDFGIQFQLATRGPDCGSTTAVNRVNGSGVPNYTAGGIAIGTYQGSADEVAVKNLSRWSNTDYVNIWIVNKINGNSNIGGFAFFPQFNSALTDGIVLITSQVNGTSKSLAHEMGHVFSLYHTFYDDGNETTCPSSASCATTGDRVCDTEPVLSIPCSATSNACTGAAFQVADADHNYTIKNNYMGYGNCAFMFTQGQKDRARAALLAFRPSLISSDALMGPDTVSTVSVCSVSAANGLSQYYGVGRFTFNDLDVYSNSAQADGAFSIDRSCNQQTTLTAGQSYTLVLAGTFGNTHFLRAYLDYNGDGDFDDAAETLLSTTNSSATVVVTIPTTTTALQLNTPIHMRVVADSPQGNSSTACNLYGESTYGSGQVEDYGVTILPRTVSSVTSGNWTDATTWSCRCVPTATDIVTVLSSHSVTIQSGLVQAGKLTLAGKIQYASGGRLLLNGQ